MRKEKTTEIKEANLRFGRNLFALREAARISRADLAKKLDLSDNSIWYYERGERQPNLYTLILLAEIFNVSVDALIKGEPLANGSVAAEPVPCALIIGGMTYPFQWDGEAFNKAQQPFTIKVTPSRFYQSTDAKNEKEDNT